MIGIKLPKQTNTISDTISHVYVIHNSGLVVLSRKYANSCTSVESQLIGGFLTAILLFTKDMSSNSNVKCAWEEDGIHRLTDIGMSCSRFFIKSMGHYSIALLVPNDSPLIKDSAYETIYDLNERILSTFILFTTFGLVDNFNTIDTIKDYSDEFGHTVDNIIFEVLAEYINPDIKYREGISTELK